MADSVSHKHFLDTSIARPILLSSSAYRQYFKEQFGNDNLYISKYVQMEFKRSYICPIIYFYFVLEMPSNATVGDAFLVWSNRFKLSEHKAILQLVGNLINTRQLDLSDPNDKLKALKAIGQYVKRLELQLRRKFRDIGVNTTRCARAKIPLVSPQQNLMTLSNQLRSFIEQFDDVKSCRSRCRVDLFLLQRYRTEVEEFIGRAETLVNPNNKENRGFIKITENLAKILHGGPDKCSCRMCGNIGDTIIALEAPRNMQLEHTDHSFDRLCEVIDQPHYKHPSEIANIKSME